VSLRLNTTLLFFAVSAAMFITYRKRGGGHWLWLSGLMAGSGLTNLILWLKERG
jgi:hypothetical protein